MKKITSIIIVICMVMTCVGTGVAERVVTGTAPEASAASYPALKTIKYKATGNQRDDIIGFALSQVGYKEGGNNNTYFGNWYGANYNPWCAMFVCWSARKAGVPKSVIPSSATADRSWAKNQGVYKKSKYWGGNYTPKKGDLIYFSWSVRDYADHIGMVTGTGKSGGTTYVYTVEGNKHDKVTEGAYPLNNRYILGYASPKYSTGSSAEPTTSAPEETYTLKYRSELTTEANDDNDALLPPATGVYGKDLILSKDTFDRPGYASTKWKIYRANSEGKIIYLCKDTATKTTEKWYKKSKIPEDYTQVFVKNGEALRINTKVDGDIYATPVWGVRAYDVIYDANGGTGAPAAQTKKYGEALTLSTEEPVREGYTFKGWADVRNAAEPQYSSGDTYTDEENATLYAIWKAKKYDAKTTAKVTARSGPGKDNEKVGTIKSGKEVKIIAISGDWAQLKDESWIPLKYTQRLNATVYQLNYQDGLASTENDSAVIPPVAVDYGTAVTTSTSKFKRTGYHYDHWKVYYLLNGDKMYLCKAKKSSKRKWLRENKIKKSGYTLLKTVPGGDLTIKKSVGEQIFITPVWTKNVYTITYDANGGTGAPKKQTVEHGKSLTLRKGVPTRKGYQFLGWATSKTATSAEYKAKGKTKPSESLKLYAVWKGEGDQYLTTDEVNKRKGPGTNYKILAVIPKGRTVTIVKKQGSWGKLKGGGWIHLSLAKKINTSQTASIDEPSKDENETGDVVEKEENSFTVRVISQDGVTARYGPDQKYDVADTYGFGDEMMIGEVKDGWGKLIGESSEQWIQLQYVRITDGYQVEVTSEDVEQRAGPGTNYDSRGNLKPGTYAIVRINDDWGKVSYTGYWINLEDAERVD